MTRRLLLLVMTLSLVGGGSTVWSDSHRTEKVWVIGNLMLAAKRDDPIITGLLKGLRELGYAEGRNLRFEFRTAHGQFNQLQRLAEELAQLKPDVIVVTAPQPARAVLRATPTVPVVAGAFDPVLMGMAKSLAHPGGQLTGLSAASPELYAKRLQLLQEMIPGLTRVAVLVDPDPLATRFRTKVVEDLKAAAMSMSITLRFVDARTPEDLQEVFSAIERSNAQALLLLESPLFYVHRATVAKLALEAKLPALYGTKAFSDAGGLMSYGVDYADQAYRIARYVDKIFKGARPNELPIEQPTNFELIVNLKTARALNVTIPDSILARADAVLR